MNAIRQELERDAWRRHSVFAQQQALKRYRVCKDFWPEVNSRSPGTRWLAWKDRLFRFLWVALTLSLMVHARLAAPERVTLPLPGPFETGKFQDEPPGMGIWRVLEGAQLLSAGAPNRKREPAL